MPHLFERRDIFGNSPAVWILAAMLFAIPVGWSSFTSLRCENGVDDVLTDDPDRKITRWVNERFGVNESILVTWDGSALGDPRLDRFLQALSPTPDSRGVLRGGVPHVAQVTDPRDLLQAMRKNEVPPQEAARRLNGMQLGAGPLRIRLTDEGRKRHRRVTQELADAARRAVGLNVTVLPAEPELAALAAVPGSTNEAGEPIESAAPAVLDIHGVLYDAGDSAHDLAVAWTGLGVDRAALQRFVEWLPQFRVREVTDTGALVAEAFFVPGGLCGFEVTLSEAGRADRVEALRQIRQAAERSGIPARSLKLGGPTVELCELDLATAHAWWNPAAPLQRFPERSVLLTSGLACMALAFVLARNGRLAIQGILTAAFATLSATALMAATGGTMTMLMVAVPILALSLTLTNALRLGQGWRQATASDNQSAVVTACRQAWGPCALACGITAMGLAALCVCPLASLRDFGGHALMGALVALFVSAVGAPSLMMVWRGQPAASSDGDHPGWRWLGETVSQRPSWNIAAAVMLAGLGGYGIVQFPVEARMLHAFRPDSHIVQQAKAIESQLAGLATAEAIIRFDAPAQNELNFVERMNTVRRVQDRLRRHPAISGCLSLADWHAVVEVPGEDAPRREQSRFQKQAAALEEQAREKTRDRAESYYAVADQDADLHLDGDRGLSRKGDELWRISARVNALSSVPPEQTLAEIHALCRDVLRMSPGSRHFVAGELVSAVQTRNAVIESVLICLGMTGGLTLLLGMVLLRSLWAGLVTAVLGLLPITAALGALTLAGVPVDSGFVIAAIIAYGIAVQGSLQLIFGFRQQRGLGTERRQALVSALMAHGPMVWQSSGVAALGFAVLAPAELLTLSHLGIAAASMMGGGLFINLGLLPSLLASPVGWMFESSRHALKSGVSSREGEMETTMPKVAPLDHAA